MVRRKIIQIAALIMFDLIALYLSLLYSLLIRENVFLRIFPDLVPVNSFFDYALSLWMLPIIFVFFIGYENLYTRRYPFWDETREIIQANTLAIIVMLAVVSLGKLSWYVSRTVLVMLWGSSLILFPLMRYYGKKLMSWLGLWRERVLILGAGQTGRLVLKGLRREKHLGYIPIGFLDDDPSKAGIIIDDKKVFGKIKHFTKFVRELKIETIIIAIPSMPLAEYAQLVRTVQKYVKQILLIPELRGISLMDTTLSCLFNEELLLINIKNNMKNPINRLIKRIFDIFFGLLIMPLLIPLIIVFAILIKLESPGRAFFMQERLGRRNTTFRIIKFRTMYTNADEKLTAYLAESPEARRQWDTYKKLKDYDPRVTKVGRFLRKTSLDELPQTFNILKGEMSFVGPRPFLIGEKTYLADCCDDICMVRPGITGLWQVSGRNEVEFSERLRLDVWYVKNWSLWLDIIIIIKTIGVVIRTKGAY
jgi:Undecaprenyl-phosphate galactose phosphotransferase WbaP